MECSYSTPLKWGIDAKESNKAFGRFKGGKVTSKLPNNAACHLELLLTEKARRCSRDVWLSCSKSRYYYINYTPDDFRSNQYPKSEENLNSDPKDENDKWEIESPKSTMVDLPSRLSFTQFTKGAVTSNEMLIFSYMVESVFPNCVCYNAKTGGVNPYLDYIVPVSMSSPVVFCSVIAAGAYLYYLKCGDLLYQDISNNYIRNVLMDLSELIQEKDAASSTSWDDVLVTVLMLCFTDISSRCDRQWLLHLKRGKSLLGHRKVIEHSNEYLLNFFVRYITSHDIMWETVKSSWELAPIENDTEIYENFKNNKDRTVDPVLGCSPYLLTLISKITNLGDCYEALRLESGMNREIFEGVIIHEALNVAADLDGLNQVMNYKSDIEHEQEGKELISEIKRLTAKIYLFARIDMTRFSLCQTNPSLSATFREKHLKMKRLTANIIELMKRVKTCTMALSWPLFVVGIVTASYEDRWFILDKFAEMENYRGLASVRLARETMEATWRERDVSENPVFTWNELVGSRGCTLSLA